MSLSANMHSCLHRALQCLWCRLLALAAPCVAGLRHQAATQEFKDHQLPVACSSERHRFLSSLFCLHIEWLTDLLAFLTFQSIGLMFQNWFWFTEQLNRKYREFHIALNPLSLVSPVINLSLVWEISYYTYLRSLPIGSRHFGVESLEFSTQTIVSSVSEDKFISSFLFVCLPFFFSLTALSSNTTQILNKTVEKEHRNLNSNLGNFSPISIMLSCQVLQMFSTKLKKSPFLLHFLRVLV